MQPPCQPFLADNRLRNRALFKWFEHCATRIAQRVSQGDGAALEVGSTDAYPQNLRHAVTRKPIEKELASTHVPPLRPQLAPIVGQVEGIVALGMPQKR